MSAALLESISKENGKLKVDLEGAAAQVTALKNEGVILKEEVRVLREGQAKAGTAQKMLERFQTKGRTPEEIEQAFQVAETKLAAYEKLGTPERIEKSLDDGTAFAKAVQSERAAWAEIGTPADVKVALNHAMKVAEGLKSLGTLPDIVAAFDRMDAEETKAKASVTEKRIKDVAAELGIDESKVRNLWGKVPEKTIRETFKGIKESVTTSSKWRRPDPKPASGGKSDEQPLLSEKGLGDRLMEQFCPVLNVPPVTAGR